MSCFCENYDIPSGLKKEHAETYNQFTPTEF